MGAWKPLHHCPEGRIQRVVAVAIGNHYQLKWLEGRDLDRLFAPLNHAKAFSCSIRLTSPAHQGWIHVGDAKHFDRLKQEIGLYR